MVLSLQLSFRAEQVYPLRLKGGGPEAEAVVEVSPPPKKRKVQFGLAKFFGSAEQKEAAQPVLRQTLQPYERKSKSRAQLEAEFAKEQYEEQLALLTEQRGNIAERGDRGRKPSQGLQLSRKPQRTQGSRLKRIELSAAKKLSMAEAMLAARDEYANPQDFWRAMVAKFSLSKRQLSHILSKRDKLRDVVKLKVAKKPKTRTKRVRHSGAGRKAPFPEVLSQLRQWLSLERACGHTMAKSDLVAEFILRLRASAAGLRMTARDKTELSPLQAQELLQQASDREARAEKLSASPVYRKSQAVKLLRWLGAKYTTTELVSNISPLEAEVRCKLTWQEFDKCLWLAALSSTQQLAEANVVASAQEFVKQRQHLVVGFSDQVPLWAKATGRKAVFGASEFHPSDVSKDFSEIRQAIAEVMEADEKPEMMVLPILDSLPQTASSALVLKEETATPEKTATPQAAAEQKEQSGATPPAPAEQKQQSGGPEPKRRLKGKQSVPSGQAGSLTTLGFSAEERFRITYEARQLLHQVVGGPEQPVLGSVGKGLLVVPGQWARLSNISEKGTWLKTETFRMGSKSVTHFEGQPVGRALEAYRKVRASHPELVSELEIMSQPASNVDSVILSWSVEAQASEYPCSVWQRDCFSSVFSDSAVQSMALAQQISCLVAAKCTSKQQITASDFAKQFKALVRQKLTALRTEFQQAQKGVSSVWRVGALEIVKSVVWAQQKMAEKNAEDSWVLRAAVRNGLLVWRPDPSSGKLEKLTTQKWAEGLELQMGSRRFPVDWLRDRLRWLDESGKPLEPDWILSDSAKEISDLLRWDYFNPEEDAENEPDQQPDLGEDLAEDLLVPLQNSLQLRIHPKLRRAELRRTAASGFQDLRSKRKERLKDKEDRAHLRKQLRGKLLEGLRKKLAQGSRKEALAEVVPQVGQKPAKLSTFNKPSAKGKPSLKLKKSQLKKFSKKQALKAEADKALQGKEQKQAAKAKAKAAAAAPSEPPPLPPPPEGPPAEFLEHEVIVTEEASGKLQFGRSGKATDFGQGCYSVYTGYGTLNVRAEHLQLRTSKADKKPFQWPKWSRLSKKDTQDLLSTLGCWPHFSLDALDTTAHTFEPLPEPKKPPEPHLLEDQQLWLGWSVLRWALKKDTGSTPEDLGVTLVDPGLLYLIRTTEDEELRPVRIEALKACTEPFSKVLLPIFASGHWTLLVLERGTELKWQLKDSLEEPLQGCQEAQVQLAQLLDPEFQLPPRANLAVQPQESNACGFWALAYAEQEVRLSRGEWLRTWPGELSVWWRQRLEQSTKALAKELSLREKDLGKAAQASLEKNSKYFTWRQLSSEAQKAVKSLEHAPCVCPKCRWQSGCLACDPKKALRYHLSKESREKQKVPQMGAGLSLLRVVVLVLQVLLSLALPAGDLQQLFESH